MIHILRQIIISVTVAAIFSAVMLAFIKDGALKEIIRLITGMLMILALFTPLTSLKLPHVTNAFSGPNIQGVSSKAAEKNETLQKNTVGNAISDYMQAQAKKLGLRCSITTQISKDKNNQLTVDSIHVNYDKNTATNDVLKKLSQQIEDECGISKEKQNFIGR